MLHIATWVRITPSHPGGAGKSSNALGSSNSFHLPVSWSMEQDMIRIPCRLSCCKAAGQLAFRKQPLESLSHQVFSPSERAQASPASRCTMKHIPLVQECSGTHQEYIRNTSGMQESGSKQIACPNERPHYSSSQNTRRHQDVACSSWQGQKVKTKIRPLQNVAAEIVNIFTNSSSHFLQHSSSKLSFTPLM